ncbi:MAG: 16S rRNA (guanine(527)-N(7))-methyltransferase RsmG [Gammaproteobacteria bacterium]
MTVESQLSAGIAALGLTLPDGAEQKLLAYLALLDKWNRVYNLTAVRDAERMVSHHLLDSLAAVPVFDSLLAARPHPNPPPEGEGASVGLRPPTAIDVGSGGGLPGIPLAIARPDLQVTLLDSIAKKTAFLLQAKAELGLANVTVLTSRVEDFPPPLPNPPPQAGEGAKAMPTPINGFDLITSRAFSDLREFVSLTRHLLKPGGRWLAMKGLYPHEEIALLPANVKVSADHALVVPGLEASRHLIVLEPVE